MDNHGADLIITAIGAGLTGLILGFLWASLRAAGSMVAARPEWKDTWPDIDPPRAGEGLASISARLSADQRRSVSLEPSERVSLEFICGAYPAARCNAWCGSKSCASVFARSPKQMPAIATMVVPEPPAVPPILVASPAWSAPNHFWGAYDGQKP